MSSVTQRIKEIKQPRGGYLKISEFDVIELDDDKILNEDENVHASVVGMAVDYLTRFMMGADVSEAFKISIIGAKCAENLGKKKSLLEISEYISNIKDLDDDSIINACKAVTFDVWLRNPIAASQSKTAKDTNPDAATIENIRILVERSLNFWEEYGPIEEDEFAFENGGYTNIVDSGDGDYLTKDTLWDFKVSNTNPKSDHTLQLLMYYIMGIHSNKPEFLNIDKLGIYNPRLNKIYVKNVKEIPDEVIEEVSRDVIGYRFNNVIDSNLPLGRKLYMPEIMRALSCTRYTVMKLYAEYNLPLSKEGNKYYINEYELDLWIEERKRIKKKEMIFSIVATLVIFGVILLIFWSLMSR